MAVRQRRGGNQQVALANQCSGPGKRGVGRTVGARGRYVEWQYAERGEHALHECLPPRPLLGCPGPGYAREELANSDGGHLQRLQGQALEGLGEGSLLCCRALEDDEDARVNQEAHGVSPARGCSRRIAARSSAKDGSTGKTGASWRASTSRVTA